MKHRVIVRPEAEDDIETAFNWYEDQEPGLGHRFRAEIGRLITLIGGQPLSFPDVYRGLRRAVANKFPYSIFFLVEERRIAISACVHHKRHPRVWMSRQ